MTPYARKTFIRRYSTRQKAYEEAGDDLVREIQWKRMSIKERRTIIAKHKKLRRKTLGR